MLEYATAAIPDGGDSNGQVLTEVLNAMAANGFELDFIYERLGEPPLAIFYRDLGD